MNDIDRILSTLPPPSADERLDQINQGVWGLVEKKRITRERFWVCSGVVTATFLIGVTVGHFTGEAKEISAEVTLLSDRI